MAVLTQKAWVMASEHGGVFEKDSVTVASLQLKEDEALHNSFIRGQELSTHLEQAAEQLSDQLLNAMVLNGLAEGY